MGPGLISVPTLFAGRDDLRVGDRWRAVRRGRRSRSCRSTSRSSADRPRMRKPQVSQELEALIMSLLNKRPGDRPASGSVVGSGHYARRSNGSMSTGRSGVPVEGPSAGTGASTSRTVGMTEAPPTEPAATEAGPRTGRRLKGHRFPRS